MKSFFKMVFASTLGVMLASIFMTFIFFLFLMAFIAVSTSQSTYKLENNSVLHLDLNGHVNDREDISPFGALFGDDKNYTVDEILTAINIAKYNDKVKGIYINAGELYSGIASLEPIRNALTDFKESGKFVIAYGDYYAQNTYYISSVADRIVMNPQGMFDFRGLSAKGIFLKNLFDKVGIKYQVFKVGTFKSAVEPYIQEKMSEANREQTSFYLSDIWEHILTGISQSRNISKDLLNQYADECLLLAEQNKLLEYRMIDNLMYQSNLEDEIKSRVGIESSKKLKLVSIKNMVSVDDYMTSYSKNRIAVLYAEGAIVDSEENGIFSSMDNVITAKEYVKELNKLKNDEYVKAVVFRVNSPGGSAYASEQIWHAVTELQKVKPVVVSMGDYAASGGYYISCSANMIVAEPTTLTGSIGIFGLLPDGEELSKKIGFSFDEVNTNKHSSLFGTPFSIPFLISAYSRGLNVEESNMFQSYIERGYDLFLSRCAEGRKKTKEEIDAVGQGRVWTGKQAVELGLVDALGGLDDAIVYAAEIAGLEDYSLESYPAVKDFFTILFEESFQNTKVKTFKLFMGEEEYTNRLLFQHMQSMDMRMAIMEETISF